jgi:hypothetical protein
MIFITTPQVSEEPGELHIDGLAGARTWCGHGIFNHNLVKISKLIT